MPATIHVDDVAAAEADLGPIGGRWRDLSGAAGSVRLGASRIEVPPGKAATPLHAEDEEVFYVLGGAGFSVQEDGCFAIGSGDVVFYGAARPAHTVAAGEHGLDVLALGTVFPMHHALRFPRLGAIKAGGLVVPGDPTHQWELEAALGPIELPAQPDPRPGTIVNVADARERPLTRGLGARGIELDRADLAPGAESGPPRCHAAEEKLFYVLEGDGVLLLGADEQEHAVRAGSVVARPAGTGVPHAFRAGASGMVLLALSDRHPHDSTYEPRTGTVTLSGLGVSLRV